MAYSQEWIFKKEFLEGENAVRFNRSTDVKKEKEIRSKTMWFIKDLSQNLRPGPPTELQKDRKDEEVEYDIRNLKVLWTACTFCHRYYVFHPFESQSRFAVAVACLFLASKVEEKPLRLSDHIFMYFRLRKNKVLKKTDQEFKDMERDVLLAERILLQTLGFDLNIVHPYQYFRQIIGKDLKAWFADPEDSKQVLRLATTLLTDSYRSVLCLVYTPQQMACGLVYLALQIMGMQPMAPSSTSYGSRVMPASTGGEVHWLDFFEKDADEAVVRDICNTLVEQYETYFAPTDVPYASTQHAALRLGVEGALGKVAELRELGGAKVNPEPAEECKASAPGDEAGVAAGGNKRKITSPTTVLSVGDPAGGVVEPAGVGSGMKPRYTTLPPPFPSSSSAGGVSPVRNAPTPRSAFRPPSASAPEGSNGGEVFPPQPDSPMSSTYSTFSQAHAQLQEKLQAAAGVQEASPPLPAPDDNEDTPVGSAGETPTFMPPPPDTPGSMASTPNFENLPRAELMGHYLPDMLTMHSAKRARTDY